MIMNIIELRTVFQKTKRCNTYVSHQQILKKHQYAKEHQRVKPRSIRTTPRVPHKVRNTVISATELYQHLKDLMRKNMVPSPQVQYRLLKATSEMLTMMLFIFFAGWLGALFYLLMDDDN